MCTMQVERDEEGRTETPLMEETVRRAERAERVQVANISNCRRYCRSSFNGRLDRPPTALIIDRPAVDFRLSRDDFPGFALNNAQKCCLAHERRASQINGLCFDKNNGNSTQVSAPHGARIPSCARCSNAWALAEYLWVFK